jgi:sphinganine-1-phosphate aldolase
MKFAEEGVPYALLEPELDALQGADADWRSGRVPLYVFKGSDDAFEAGRAAFFKFFSENALGAARAFPSLRKLEADIVAMGLELLNAPPGATGNMTSGGSESIFMAVRAAREYARVRRGDRRFNGNIVMAESAHPAFSKAASVMSLEERRVPVAPDFRADVGAMTAAIDDDTMMIVGSAPCFPYGVIDPIEELGEVAARRGSWLHVDACIGGYLAPFVRDLGRPVPAFDLAVPAVHSLSADLHKFGFCPKPASTVYYRSAELAAYQVFDLDVWPSGRFVTSTLVGTRPGGAVAGAWATMKALGRSGYREIAARLMAMRDAYVADLDTRAGFRPLGHPHLTVMAFRREDVDVFRVAELMAARGWVPGLVRQPPALHLMMSMLHEPARERFVDDLVEATRQARAEPEVAAALRATY